MASELTPEESSFIERFQLENELLLTEEEPEDEEAIALQKRTRGAVVFYSFMGFLALCPFILSATFIYSLNKYESLIGNQGLKFLDEALSSDEVAELSDKTGYSELEFFVNLYHDRYTIIAWIFTFFFSLIIALTITRLVVIHFRNKNG